MCQIRATRPAHSASRFRTVSSSTSVSPIFKIRQYTRLVLSETQWIILTSGPTGSTVLIRQTSIILDLQIPHIVRMTVLNSSFKMACSITLPAFSMWINRSNRTSNSSSRTRNNNSRTRNNNRNPGRRNCKGCRQDVRGITPTQIATNASLEDTWMRTVWSTCT
ncbi:hypothetical protein MPH_01620 [Macrophomina phaseolina MS6]|uniref:Uncharacterized protein n=1 Tax=Macrophomina phaseolina (strain MS6) TaxID=1126212 RepID=K2RF17_MACPH|nr:hypothetical protein MPH_01620 [Macrophomina phaseolina MS6]